MKKATIKHPLNPNKVLTIYVDDEITGIMQLRKRTDGDDSFFFGCGVDIFKTNGGRTLMTTTLGYYANDFVEFAVRYLQFEYSIAVAKHYRTAEYMDVTDIMFCDDPIFSTPNQPIDGSTLFLKADDWQDIDKSEFINNLTKGEQQ